MLFSHWNNKKTGTKMGRVNVNRLSIKFNLTISTGMTLQLRIEQLWEWKKSLSFYEGHMSAADGSIWITVHGLDTLYWKHKIIANSTPQYTLLATQMTRHPYFCIFAKKETTTHSVKNAYLSKAFTVLYTATINSSNHMRAHKYFLLDAISSLLLTIRFV